MTTNPNMYPVQDISQARAWAHDTMPAEYEAAPLVFTEASDPNGLAANLHNLEQSVNTLADLRADPSALKSQVYVDSNILIDSIGRASPGELSDTVLLQLTSRLADLFRGNVGRMPDRQRQDVGFMIGQVLNSYSYRFDLDNLPIPDLLSVTELAVATSDNPTTGDMTESVYRRCHNDLFGDQAPAIVRSPAFTSKLLGRFMRRELALQRTPDPREMMRTGRDVARAAELHLRAYGFSAQEAAAVSVLWGTMTRGEDSNVEELNDRLEANIDRINSLERQDSGITLRLFRERGIAHFGRYSDGLLLQQFEPLPEGVKPDFMVMPHADHNSAFVDTVEQLEASLGSEDMRRFRIAEAGSPEALVSTIQQLTAEFGLAQNLLIGGHGNTETIQLSEFFVGKELLHTMLHIDHVKEQLERLKLCLLPGGALVLVSCSTGAEGAIGTAISHTIQRSTQAPATPANIKDVRRAKSGRLVVEFHDDAGRTVDGDRDRLELAA